MRLDPAHVKKLSQAISSTPRGTPEVQFNISFMMLALTRLSLWERGLLMQALMRAATSKRKTIEQRALLAMFVHQEGDAS